MAEQMWRGAYSTGEMELSQPFPSAPTCMKLAGATGENEAQVLMIGFKDGTLRLLRPAAELAWQLLHASKPHAGDRIASSTPVAHLVH